MPETPRLRHGNRNRQNLYLLREDGSEEEFAGVAMTPEYAEMIVGRFNATTEADIRADERRKVAEEIAAEIERVVVSGHAPRPQVERGGFLNDARWAARIARQTGDARDPR